MKKLLLLLPLLITIGLQAPAESPFEDFVVSILPEYDDQGILVMYGGIIKDGFLPLELQFRIPDRSSDVFAMGQTVSADRLLPIRVEERADGEWAAMEVVQKQVQIEYYFNPFDETDVRKAELTLEFSQPLSTFHVQLQEPLAAEGFDFPEPGAETFADPHGTKNYRLHVPSLAAGEKKTISFSYRNPSRALTVSLLRDMIRSGSEPAPTDTVPTRYRLPTYQPLLVFSVLAVVIAFLFWNKNYRSGSKIPKSSGEKSCPRCGSSIMKGDKFCPNCGKRLT